MAAATTSTIDYYKVLKLDPSADAEDIRRAYRHLALKVYHILSIGFYKN